VDRDIDGFEGRGEICAKMVTSKREFKCCECSKIILPGEKFEMIIGEWNGIYTHSATCKICLEIRARFVCNWYMGQMWEDIQRKLEEYPDAIALGCLDGLSPEAFGLIVDMLEEIWQEVVDEHNL
jgi:hypothetical protein